MFLRISIVLTGLVLISALLLAWSIGAHHGLPGKAGQITNDKYWTKIAVGEFHSIALDEKNDIWGWGENGCGQLAHDDSTPYFIAPDTVHIPSCQWKEIACGGYHTMAIDDIGYLWAWGDDVWGQLGLGDNATALTSSKVSSIRYVINPQIVGDDPATPGTDDTAYTWKTVACGYMYTAAIKTDGTLWAWGDNEMGLLGLEDARSRNTPTQIGRDNNWQSVACGWFHAVAIKTDGSLWLWGDQFAYLSGNVYKRITVPVQVGQDKNWKQISAGYGHSAGLKTDGTLWTWGHNQDGQLGLGDTITRTSPAQVGKATNWKQVACGRSYTAAIKTDGTLWVWGDSDFGVLGQGYNAQNKLRLRFEPTITITSYGDGRKDTVTPSKRPKYYIDSPMQIGTDNDWQQIACGESHILAIKTNGTLWGWGDNTSHQLGLGQAIPNPIQINRQ